MPVSFVLRAGSAGNLSWTAQSVIVGVTSTGTLATGGDSRYVAPMPQYSGVVSLIMDYGPGGAFICSGTLLPDRQSILTAAHCVSDGAGTAGPLSTTAYFYGGSDPDTVVPFNPVSTAVARHPPLREPELHRTGDRPERRGGAAARGAGARICAEL